VFATAALDEALANATLVLLAAPSHAVRDLLTAMRSNLQASAIIVSLTKGIETDSGKRISEVVSDVLRERLSSTLCLFVGSIAFAKK
jgi:glycerol-3-phosphate dehydrogenase (NAD(P)+)